MKIFGVAFGTDVVEDGRNVMISGLRVHDLKRFIKKMYGSGIFLDKMCKRTWSNSLLLDRFFLPEILFLLKKGIDEHYLPAYRTNKIIDLIYTNTWMKSTQEDIRSIVDLSVLNTEINNITPTPTQKEFLTEVYWQKKTQYHLNGYLLGLPMGAGKTLCSLMLSAMLHKKHTVVISPLSVVSSTWVPEIEKAFKTKKRIWTPSEDPSKITSDVDHVVVNYDALPKVIPYILKNFKASDTMVIIDEFHNYKDIKSQRTNILIEFLNTFKCTDILPMSGTPVKALGIEAIPILQILDPWCDKLVVDKLRSMMRHTKIINDLLRNRLGYMMFRKEKSEIMDLPPKHEQELKITIADGDRYTLDNVKKLVVEFTRERRDFYNKNYKQYLDKYTECLRIFEKTLSTRQEQLEYNKYLKNVALIQKHGHGWDMIEFIKESNIYEKTVILPALPPNMRATFRDVKSVIKYVELKILGEVLGGLLNQLRTEMSAEMIGREVIDIIVNADKKTILFSSYREAISIAEKVCVKYNLKPMVITGDNSSEAKMLLDKFKSDPDINPVIASIKAMSTGHTVIEANTVIFLNVPFRSVDYDQASDRVYRIGQDTDVYIYKLVLDTGDKPNLSTRMQDIIAWSKEQFDSIIIGVSDDDTGISNTETTLKGILDRSSPDLLSEYTNFISKMGNNILNKFRK